LLCAALAALEPSSVAAPKLGAAIDTWGREMSAPASTAVIAAVLEILIVLNMFSPLG
jgi:hypothetical protein